MRFNGVNLIYWKYDHRYQLRAAMLIWPIIWRGFRIKLRILYLQTMEINHYPLVMRLQMFPYLKDILTSHFYGFRVLFVVCLFVLFIKLMILLSQIQALLLIFDFIYYFAVIYINISYFKLNILNNSQLHYSIHQ